MKPLQGIAGAAAPAAGRAGTVRTGTSADASAIHALIARYQAPGRLLPRDHAEITRHATRFLVVEDADGVAACAELMPLGPGLGEIRSLVVDERARGLGLGRRLVEAIAAEAPASGVERLCVFTHEPGYFARLGFSLVPHRWLPEKIGADCAGCALFRRCGQAAMERRLSRAFGAVVDDRACA